MGLLAVIHLQHRRVRPQGHLPANGATVANPPTREAGSTVEHCLRHNHRIVERATCIRPHYCVHSARSATSRIS